MVQINFALREVNCKIVYYGPGMSGKTTNLEKIHEKAPKRSTGELTSIATEGDRTLFFDFLPLDLGNVAGMKTKFQLYTVPGQVYYNATRKLVLQGCDGVVFVADSQAEKLGENIESIRNLAENLAANGFSLDEMPLVIQWNKRDLPNVLPVDELDRQLNKYGAPTFEAVATTGEGVFPTLKSIAKLVLDSLNEVTSKGAAAPPPPKVQQQAQASAPRRRTPASEQSVQRVQPPPRTAVAASQAAVTQAAAPQSAQAAAGGDPPKLKLQSAQEFTNQQTVPQAAAPTHRQAARAPAQQTAPASPPPARPPGAAGHAEPPPPASAGRPTPARSPKRPSGRVPKRGRGNHLLVHLTIIGCILFLCFILFVFLARDSLEWCAAIWDVIVQR